MDTLAHERQCMRCGKPERDVGALVEVTLATVGGFWRVCARCLAALRVWKPKLKKGAKA